MPHWALDARGAAGDSMSRMARREWPEGLFCAGRGEGHLLYCTAGRLLEGGLRGLCGSRSAHLRCMNSRMAQAAMVNGPRALRWRFRSQNVVLARMGPCTLGAGDPCALDTRNGRGCAERTRYETRPSRVAQ